LGITTFFIEVDEHLCSIYVYITRERLSRATAGRPRSKYSRTWYADQILPFDITIAGANEYGAAASAKLFGVEILNEGFGTSIDDTVIEQQATFVAQSIAPLQAVGTAQLIAGA
jgi:hypothetical protein